jgi:hypothetical protein
MRHMWGTFTLILISAITRASGQEFCTDVLRYAAYNYSSDAIQYSAIKNAFDQYCDGSRTQSGKNLDIGLSVIVKAVPIGFNLGSGSSEEKVTSFCRTTKTDIDINFQKYQADKLVSPAAMKAYEACLSLYEKGIDFKPTILQDQVLVDIRKRSADVEQVLGISADPDKLVCTVPNDDAHDNSAVALPASISTRKSLKDGNFWSVTCRRSPSREGTTTVYPSATITVATSRGGFGLTIPPDSQLPVQDAQTIQSILSRMSGDIDQLKALSTFEFTAPRRVTDGPPGDSTDVPPPVPSPAPFTGRFCAFTQLNAITGGYTCKLVYDSSNKVWTATVTGAPTCYVTCIK